MENFETVDTAAKENLQLAHDAIKNDIRQKIEEISDIISVSVSQDNFQCAERYTELLRSLVKHLTELESVRV
jgi:transcription initiation factor IIE alpha subunit